MSYGKLAASILVLALLAGCGPTAEEQRAMDGQTCSGYGFAPYTTGFANCMMNVSQQRAAQNAADHRAFLARQAQEERARQDRDAADRARDETESQQRRDDFQREMNSGSTGIEMPDVGKMNCTSSSIANAGSLSCN